MDEDERGATTASQAIAFALLVGFVFVQPWRHAVSVAPGVSIAPAVAVMLIGSWVVLAIRTRSVRRPHAFHVAFGFFTALSVASLLWTVDAGRTLARVAILGYTFVVLFVAWDLLRTRERIAVVSQALVVGVFVVGLVGIVDLIQQGGLYSRENLAYGVNANELARWVVLAVPFAAGLLVDSRRFGTGTFGYLNVAYLVLSPFMVLATGSRQGAVGFGALVVVGLLVVARRGRPLRIQHRQVVFSLVLLALSVASIRAVTSLTLFFDRLPFAFSRVGTLGGRTTIWAEGIAAFLANPLLGVGAGAYGAITPAGMSADPHSAVVGVAAELGVVGLVSFALVVSIPVLAAIRSPAPTYASLAILLVLGLFASVAMMYNNPFNWLVMLLVLAAHSVPTATSTASETALASRLVDRDTNAAETAPEHR